MSEGLHDWRLVGVTEQHFRFACLTCERQKTRVRDTSRTLAEATSVRLQLPKGPCDPKVTTLRGVAADLVIRGASTTEVGEELPKLVHMSFVALPRVGENIRIDKHLFHVEQIDWEPYPAAPKITIRLW